MIHNELGTILVLLAVDNIVYVHPGLVLPSYCWKYLFPDHCYGSNICNRWLSRDISSGDVIQFVSLCSTVYIYRCISTREVLQYIIVHHAGISVRL